MMLFDLRRNGLIPTPMAGGMQTTANFTPIQISGSPCTNLRASECPEECGEAVASFMFTVARFSYLPELRVLRTAFFEKYGSSLDLFVNKRVRLARGYILVFLAVFFLFSRK